MISDKSLLKLVNSGVNVIIARFLIAVSAVILLVAILTVTGVFLITIGQASIIMLAGAPATVYGLMVLFWKRARNSNKTRYILCVLMCLQAVGVALAGYSYAGTVVLLLPVLLSAMYPKSRLGWIVSGVMLFCGLVIPPVALMLGLWDGPYYEFLYDLSNARVMDTSILSDQMLTRTEQVVDAIRFCSTQNVLIIGGFAVIGRLIYRQTNRSFDNQRNVIRLSETDELTGLLNRNCFERRLDEVAAFSGAGTVCFYFDVNGLHEMNNQHGHKAGDAMLQFVAKKIQDVFGEENAFRIGGDEYVAFSGKLDAGSLPRVKESMEAYFAEHNYHVAIGYARSNGTAAGTDDLVQLAEREMYQAKALYYTNHDRRR